ncbi:MAG: hypothetical protein QCI82_02910 [Candidatus Thermoplasmatota archaeon]|nr:hypothetical protein [Candidatus Thermoplasmatota archaeon]
MRPTIGMDTSAMVSLGHTDIVSDIVDNYQIVISRGVLFELKEIANRDDPDGRSAKKWLSFMDMFLIMESTAHDNAEDDMQEICLREDIVLFTDDVRWLKRYKGKVDCFFSVHILYLLYRKGLISLDEALISLSLMRNERDWRDNVIIISARTLFKHELEI